MSEERQPLLRLVFGFWSCAAPETGGAAPPPKAGFWFLVFGPCCSWDRRSGNLSYGWFLVFGFWSQGCFLFFGFGSLLLWGQKEQHPLLGLVLGFGLLVLAALGTEGATIPPRAVLGVCLCLSVLLLGQE